MAGNMTVRDVRDVVDQLVKEEELEYLPAYWRARVETALRSAVACGYARAIDDVAGAS